MGSLIVGIRQSGQAGRVATRPAGLPVGDMMRADNVASANLEGTINPRPKVPMKRADPAAFADSSAWAP